MQKKMTSCERDRLSSDQLRDQTGEKTRLKYNVELLCEIRGNKDKICEDVPGWTLKQAGRCSNPYKEANHITTMPRKVVQNFSTTRFVFVSASHTFLTKFVPLQS